MPNAPPLWSTRLKGVVSATKNATRTSSLWRRRHNPLSYRAEGDTYYIDSEYNTA